MRRIHYLDSVAHMSNTLASNTKVTIGRMNALHYMVTAPTHSDSSNCRTYRDWISVWFCGYLSNSWVLAQHLKHPIATIANRPVTTKAQGCLTRNWQMAFTLSKERNRILHSSDPTTPETSNPQFCNRCKWLQDLHPSRHFCLHQSYVFSYPVGTTSSHRPSKQKAVAVTHCAWYHPTTITRQ